MVMHCEERSGTLPKLTGRAPNLDIKLEQAFGLNPTIMTTRLAPASRKSSNSLCASWLASS
eukprot:CAMPEP_0115252292 /NCGR_PEP_ID=MMETSP0270-20121206/44069_1 /TAXON_ID=71861 /ORGANISM="Scrippsiella trochoidea, Strain CCMP3099" /LENGTH=60 /DNA_ID=CAMNT_0002667737 /DNA_START=20 /DNA_END=202 /DNA_ORIENTATION=+